MSPERVVCSVWLRGWGVGARFLVDHELLEGVQVRRDERADRLVVVVEDLLPVALGAGRAGGADQAGVGRAVTLEETRRPSESVLCVTLQHVPNGERSFTKWEKIMRVSAVHDCSANVYSWFGFFSKWRVFVSNAEEEGARWWCNQRAPRATEQIKTAKIILTFFNYPSTFSGLLLFFSFDYFSLFPDFLLQLLPHNCCFFYCFLSCLIVLLHYYCCYFYFILILLSCYYQCFPYWVFVFPFLQSLFNLSLFLQTPPSQTQLLVCVLSMCSGSLWRLREFGSVVSGLSLWFWFFGVAVFILSFALCKPLFFKVLHK